MVTGALCVLTWQPGCTTSSTGTSNKTGARSAKYPKDPKYPEAEVLRSLQSPKASLRRATIDRLMRDGAQARPLVDALVQMLSSRDWQVVKTATVALGAVGPAAAPALPALVKAFRRHRKVPASPRSQRKEPQQAPPGSHVGQDHPRMRWTATSSGG